MEGGKIGWEIYKGNRRMERGDGRKTVMMTRERTEFLMMREETKR